MTEMPGEGTQVSVNRCPTEEFSGRYDERKKISDALSHVKERGQVIMISGARGSGKSSLLDWVEYEIQRADGGLESPAFKEIFLETPGMIMVSYGKLLTDIQGHTKFGWFKNIVRNESMKKGLTALIGIVKDYTTPVDPAGILVRTGEKLAEAYLPSRPIGHDPVLIAFLGVFRKLSEELSQKDGCVAILLDEAQWSSDIDFILLKDLIRNIPPGIALIFTYRLETATQQKYEELQAELLRHSHPEIKLAKMQSDCITELLKLRYELTIDEATADFLKENIGDPLCLIACMNLLQKEKLPVTIENIRANMHAAIENPAKVIYRCLDDAQAKWANCLCVLSQPMPLTIMACMLQYQPGTITSLQDGLEKSYVIIKIEKGSYEFAHPSLREYRKDQLPDEDFVTFHAKAAKCFKDRVDKLPDKQYGILSLAEHAFYGEDYETASDLNFRLGNQYYDHYNYSTALELMNRAKISAQELNDLTSASSSLHQIGMICEDTNRFADALDYYQQSLEISQELGNRVGEASTLHQIGMVYEATNQFSDALAYYNRSLVIERELGNRAGEAIVLHQIGMVYGDTNQFSDALDYYQQSLEISQELGNRVGEASTLHQIGMICEDTNRFADALDYYQQSLEISQELGNRAGEAIVLHQIGMVYEDTNQFTDALDYYQQSLVIKRELGNRAGEASTLHQIGMVYQDKNRSDDALAYYNRSLAINKELGNRTVEVSTLHQIGIVYQDTNRHDDALKYYQQSLTITRELGNHASEATALHQIGMVYQDTNRYDDALAYYNRSLAINRELGGRAGEAITIHQIGMLYEDVNRYADALAYYNRSLAINRELGNRAGESSSLHQIGMVYQKTNRWADALVYYNQSLVIERELGNRASESSSLHQIGMVYQDTNRYDDALKYYDQSLTINRELGNHASEVLTLAQMGVIFGDMSKFDDSVHHFCNALSIAVPNQMPVSDQIISVLAMNLDQMGEEPFTAAVNEAFQGDELSVFVIQEVKRRSEEGRNSS